VNEGKNKGKYEYEYGSDDQNPMLRPRVEKIIVNMGIGSSGDKLVRAENVLEDLTGNKVVRTKAKQTIKSFGIKEGEPIGCKTTLRGEDARDFLERALEVKGNVLSGESIDEQGNFSFGIDEHTNFEGVEYDPDVGIFGMDVVVVMERPGYRVSRRSQDDSEVGDKHSLKPEDVVLYLEEEFGVEVKETDEF